MKSMEYLLIDDMEENVESAKKAGINGFVLKNNSEDLRGASEWFFQLQNIERTDIINKKETG